MIQQSALFRQDFLDGSPATASYIANLVAGLERVGVANADSAEIFDLYNKAMTNSPAESGAALLSLTSISKSLGIETSKSFSNFKSVMGPLSQFGSRMTGVFAKLQARAAATGTSLSKLSGIAEGMDTFEGAAKAAQTLNGILGDTFINVTDLALAEPDEKIKMITDAIKDSGVEFDSLNRQYKKIISTAAGFDSVGEFQRQLFNEEEINRSTAALDLKAMSMKDLNSLVVDGLSIAEKQQRARSVTGAMAATGIASGEASADAIAAGTAELARAAANITNDPQLAFLATKLGIDSLSDAANTFADPKTYTDPVKGALGHEGEGSLGVLGVGAAGMTIKELVERATGSGTQKLLTPPASSRLPSVGPQASAARERPSEVVVMSFDPDTSKGLMKLIYKGTDTRLSQLADRARRETAA